MKLELSQRQIHAKIVRKGRTMIRQVKALANHVISGDIRMKLEKHLVRNVNLAQKVDVGVHQQILVMKSKFSNL